MRQPSSLSIYRNWKLKVNTDCQKTTSKNIILQTRKICKPYCSLNLAFIVSFRFTPNLFQNYSPLFKDWICFMKLSWILYSNPYHSPQLSITSHAQSAFSNSNDFSLLLINQKSLFVSYHFYLSLHILFLPICRKNFSSVTAPQTRHKIDFPLNLKHRFSFHTAHFYRVFNFSLHKF